MQLSVIIPAYNEEKRLPNSLERMLNYLEAHFANQYELIIVNDGSTDGTIGVVEEFSARFPNRIRLISYTPNRGRGVAVRRGVTEATGEYVLETDADGSVDDEAIVRFFNTLHTGAVDALMGSRNAPGAKILTHQSWVRVCLGNMFLWLARIVFGFPSTDYALGFKMFTRAAAQDIFTHQYDDHFLAEAEVYYVAKRRGWRTQELPVYWTDFRDSKVHPFRDSIRSLSGLGKIFMRNKRRGYE
ncbi:MAG: dolichyl-phosphate beta-glucosyltransferase [Patescibacteria group bacterium]